jgi:outer membrane usher protein FimD/PapC
MAGFARGRVPGARRLRSPRAAVFACALLVASAAPRAQDAPMIAQLGATVPEQVVVQVVLNQEKKGEYFITVVDGRFLARVQDLQAAGVPVSGARTTMTGGQEYAWIDSIPGVQATFDEAQLELNLVADPKLLPRKTIDLWAGRSPQVAYPDNASAFFNYDIGYAGGNGSVPDGFFATTEVGARYGDFLLLSNSNCATNAPRGTCIRLNTSLIHDNRETLTRTIAGDIGFATNALGSTLQMGGLSYSKLYDIDPYLIRYPQQNLVGTLPTASEVEVYIDGQRVRTLRLPAGEFDLRNVTQATGYRSVDLVIRDAFGREQRVTTSFYSSERSLKQGLHEWSYNVGALRESFGVESNDYGPLAFAGFHRYGVTDAITLGGRAEGKSGLVSGGPSATIVIGSMGTLTLAASASEYQGKTGGAALASYSYLGQHWSASAFARKDSLDYANLTTYGVRRPLGFDPAVDSGYARRNWEAAASVGYASPALGSLSVGYYAFDAYQGQDRKAATLGYGRSLFDGRASVFVTLVNERAQDKRTDIYAGFQYNFDSEHYLSGYYQRVRGGTSETLQFQQAQPVGEGLGYTVGVSRFEAQGRVDDLVHAIRSSTTGDGARCAATRSKPAPTETQRSYALSVAGGIAWTRRNDRSRTARDRQLLGVVKVGRARRLRVLRQQPGDRPHRGPTGACLVPALSSFNDNQFSIDVGQRAPSSLRSPSRCASFHRLTARVRLVNFHARALRAFVGTLRSRSNGATRPPSSSTPPSTVEGRPVTFVTGRGGEFYVEDLPPGRYRGRMSSNGVRCTFELDVRAPQGPLTDLGETTCERDEDSTERAGASN